MIQQDMKQIQQFQRPRVQKSQPQQADHQKINLDLQKTKICPIIKQGVILILSKKLATMPKR